MTNLDDIRAYIQANLTRVLAFALMAISGMGVLLFLATNVLPAWKAHNDLAAQVVSAQDALQAQQDSGQTSADLMGRQADLVQTHVAQQATVLLTEKEASQVLANLYGYAKDAGTQVVDLQAQPAPKTDTKTQATASAPLPYTIRVFRLTVAGDAEKLVDFLSRFREAALPGVTLSNLKMAEKDGSTTLVVDVMMYTSPYAPGNVLQTAAGAAPVPLPLPDTPTPDASTSPSAEALSAQAVVGMATGTGTAVTQTTGPTGTGSAGSSAATGTPSPTMTPITPTPTITNTPIAAVEGLLKQLDTEWAAENWPAIISLSQQILAIDPTTAGLSVKLYTAHTNYGYQLASQGKTDEAKAEFTAALTINPDGAAALAGLKMLSNGSATPAPAVKIYVVQWGDTLANLAIHYNVSVERLKAANHLLDDRIYAGQELIIPLQ